MKRSLLFVILGVMSIQMAQAQVLKKEYLDATRTFGERSKSLVSEMVLDEKVLQVCFEAPAIERLGIPEYNWWNECLHGVARAGMATVFPQAIGMSAMFDKDAMFRIGDAISDEARAKYNDFSSRGMRDIYQGLTMWTPNINLFRDPRWGRGMESYGEDPYLSGELAVDFIKGLQGDDPKYYKTIATAKHFVVHSGPEKGRHSFNSTTSLRDFYETYTPHFRKAIQEGGVYSIMCAYNRYNGDACCGSKFFDNLLRNSWGFNGFIVSDCGAIDDIYHRGAHELVETSAQASAMGIRGGTDLCCGGAYKDLAYAVRDGIITEKEVDVSVERVMEARLRLGLFAPTGEVKYDKIPFSVVDCQKHRDLALEAARKSMVLLKNDNILPLRKDAKKIAVIGPNADAVDMLLSNYNGFPSYAITALEGIRAKLPNAEVVYAAGAPLAGGLPVYEQIPAKYLHTATGNKGVEVELFRNSDLSGTPAFHFTEANFNSQWFSQPQYDMVRYTDFAIRMTSYVEAPESGNYGIGGETYFANKIYVGDSLVKNRDQKFPFIKGQRYKLVIEYTKHPSDYPVLRALWNRPEVDYVREAQEAARAADYVIYCMGISPGLEGEEMPVQVEGFEGGDRLNIDLPAVQSELMKRVAEVNPNGVMVIFSGSALAVNWEAENIPALLQAWYPGQEGGKAVADVLFGDYNPAGRLPVTFYKSTDQLGHFHDYNMTGKTYRFFEGEPLFEFGHGLSYTTFRYSKLTATKSVATDGQIKVSVRVSNTGKRDGDEVVQLYVSHPTTNMPVPKRSLQGFERVSLKAGESRIVEFTLSGEQLAVVDALDQFVVEPGTITVSVGGGLPTAARIASGDVLTTSITLTGEEYKLKF